MKKAKMFLCALVALATLFTSCKKEEEKASTDSYVASTYKGSVVMSVGGTNYDPFDAEIKLEGNGKNAVKLTLPEVSSGMSTIPALTVGNISVTTSDYKRFILSETSFDQTVNDTKYSGKVSGTVNDGKLTLNYSVKPGAMPMSINFVFTTNDK